MTASAGGVVWLRFSSPAVPESCQILYSLRCVWTSPYARSLARASSKLLLLGPEGLSELVTSDVLTVVTSKQFSETEFSKNQKSYLFEEGKNYQLHALAKWASN